MKNNTWTIMRKELARFFGDRGIFFAVVIMPGLMIYLIYTLVGNNIDQQVQEDTEAVTTVYVDNMPAQLTPLFDSLPCAFVTQGFESEAVKKKMEDKEVKAAYMCFPKAFMDSVAVYDPACGRVAPNVQIFYNANSPNSAAAFAMLTSVLDAYESSMSNRFDVNMAEAPDAYNMGDDKDMAGDIFGQMMPMLIMMMLFSACMSLAPTSIAGEKERGTIATLLVTPMRRNQLAWGKILGLSIIALLSGVSSFLGIILSLPKMMHMDDLDLGGSLYSAGDYVQLLVLILSTVLVLVGVISIVSAYAKSVKSAQTMTLPLMILVMAASFSPMLGSAAVQSVWPNVIPFYNSVQSMAAVFGHTAVGVGLPLTVLANLAYTALCVWALTKMFNSEKVMFGK